MRAILKLLSFPASGPCFGCRSVVRYWFVLAIALLPAGWARVATAELPPAPGPYIAPANTSGPSFSALDKILFTYYFYWYDSRTNHHIVDDDGSDALQTHPSTWPSMQNPEFSYKSAAWYEKELNDINRAGIDVILPVYWGLPGITNAFTGFSFGGLPPLVTALDNQRNRGIKTPRVGLFLDTTLFANTDLVAEQGKELFYGSIRDFYSMIPPEYWARIGGKPVVWLYTPAQRYDQSTFDYASTRFARDFSGQTLHIVKEVSWTNVNASGVYAWGAALGRHVPEETVRGVGPGYNDRAVPGRTHPIVERDYGRFFFRGWESALATGKRHVVVETWNEFHEGSDIAESYEYGTNFVTMNGRFAEVFHGARNISSNSDYVTFLYEAILGRAPDAGGLAHYVDQLNRGVSRQAVADGLIDAAENAARYPLLLGSQILSRTIPAILVAGERATASVVFRNTGKTPWRRQDFFRLGSTNPRENMTWGLNRIEMPHASYVWQGQTVTFGIDLVAPSSRGDIPFSWQMVRENERWFGETLTDAILVTDAFGHRDQEFVEATYRYYFGRPADRTGLKEHVNGLQQGQLRSYLINVILDSTEYRQRVSDNDFVRSLYVGIMGREPDSSGLNYYTSELRSGRKRSDVLSTFLNTAEFRQRISDSNFVTVLYRRILGREPDPSGLAGNVAALQNGMSRSTLRNGFLDSRELRQDRIIDYTNGASNEALLGWRF
jgi:hypothetical protein